MKRGNFRLHPGLLSEGCIILPHDSDFALLRNVLLRREKIDLPCMRKLKTYGITEVIANGQSCSQIIPEDYYIFPCNIICG